MMTNRLFVISVMTSFLLALSGCTTTDFFNEKSSSKTTLAASSTVPPVNLHTFPHDPAFWQGNTATIWHRLQQIPFSQLQMANNQLDPTIAGWITLAVISKQYANNTPELVPQLMSWRAQNAAHPGNTLFPDNTTLDSLQNLPKPTHLGLLLPLQGKLAPSGQTIRDGFLSAYYESLGKTHQQQTTSFYDTSTTTDVRSLYQQAIAAGADTIIGPLTKENVRTLLGQRNFAVPTLALNYTDLWGGLPANFYEFGLSPDDEIQQTADKAAFAGYSRAIIIAPQNDWGQRVAKKLMARWQSSGGRISDVLYFNDRTNLTQSIAELLHVNPVEDRKTMQNDNNKTTLAAQRRQDVDVIFLLASPASAREIVPLLKYYYADNIPIYATSAVYSGTPSPQDNDLNGVIFSDIPWILQNMGSGTKSVTRDNRLYAVGRDAYLLGNELSRLKALPNFPLQGATGALSLTSQQKIYRYLSWAQIHDGHP